MPSGLDGEVATVKIVVVGGGAAGIGAAGAARGTDKSAEDRKSTRLNSSHSQISYAVFCLKKKKNNNDHNERNEHNEDRFWNVIKSTLSYPVIHKIKTISALLSLLSLRTSLIILYPHRSLV